MSIAHRLSLCQQASPEVSTGFAKKLEQFQTRTLKTLINCPRNTPPAVVRLFCGVEPLTCRLEILKLRYFWRVSHTPTATIVKRILTYRKRNLLTFLKGIGHQVFNICCKYNAIDIWNGLAPKKMNPLHNIKRIITAANLGKDIQIARNCICSSMYIYLFIQSL